ncbi:response regulator [Sphingobacteriaceae bacterium]|nr:response regulator [Sphingobacteriaceae bacterium]
MTEFKKLHIIIAEDDLDDGEFIQKSFSKHPSFARIDWVKNGRELLHFLKTTSPPPDIILTDINMPILNGIEALEHIFKDRALSDIPSFVCSSTVNPMYELKCKELGIKSFLIKPFSLSDYDDIPYQILYVLNQGRSSGAM